MPNPTSRHSRCRRDKRRANYKGKVPSLGKCSECGEPKLLHKVCADCGMYNGRKVIEVVEKEQL